MGYGMADYVGKSKSIETINSYNLYFFEFSMLLDDYVYAVNVIDYQIEIKTKGFSLFFIYISIICLTYLIIEIRKTKKK